MPAVTACPENQVLQQFAFGKMSPADMIHLAEHCEHCEHCIQTLQQMRGADTVRIGHPAGVIETETRVEKNGAGEYVVRRATLGRTARRIMEGYVFVPDTSH